MQSECCRFKGVFSFPENRQEKVRVPFGDIYTDKNFNKLRSKIKDIQSKGKYIASVGDRVTYFLLKNNIVPDIGVIDGKERRGNAPYISHSYFNRVYQAYNEKGTVNMNLCCFIKNILRERPVLLIIKGEEDLVGFPVTLALSIGSAFLYGQPNVGAVLVYIDEEVKEQAIQLLNSLEKLHD